ncbi:MAG: nitroreductase family deazaflavin-dependent oxidoreductase [Mycobacteriaceae bacterium]
MAPTDYNSRRFAFPRWLAHFNKRVTNRIQSLWSPYLPPWAVVIHNGRKTGKTYRTPVLAFKKGNRIGIGLPYGEDAQWVKNLLAASGGGLIRSGKTYEIKALRVADAHDQQVPKLAGLGSGLTRRVLVLDLTQSGGKI